MDSHPPIAPISPAVAAALDAVGDLMAFWGFQRSHGRIWALLYVAERELSAADLGQLLQLSAGQMSMALRELERWGVVHSMRPSGQRRTTYAAETNIFRMVTRVFADRELEQIRALGKALLAARAELADQTDPVQKLRLRRIEGLVAVTEIGREVVQRLVGGSLLPKWVTQALDRPMH